MQKKKILFGLSFIFIELLLIYLAISSGFSLNENSLLYISSTMAQVIATLYGLTITGYIFFDDKLKMETDKDDSLIDIIEVLKLDYRKTLFKLGGLIAISIFLCFANIILLNIINLFDWISKVILYNSIFATVLCIILILCFIIRVVDPKKYQKVSEQEKRKIDNDNSENDKNYMEDFMREFHGLEEKLKKIASPYFNGPNKGVYNYLTIIRTYKLLNDNIIGEINDMRRYRNYVVHGADAFVHEKMYKQLQKVNEYLKTERDNNSNCQD